MNSGFQPEAINREISDRMNTAAALFEGAATEEAFVERLTQYEAELKAALGEFFDAMPEGPGKNTFGAHLQVINSRDLIDGRNDIFAFCGQFVLSTEVPQEVRERTTFALLDAFEITIPLRMIEAYQKQQFDVINDARRYMPADAPDGMAEALDAAMDEHRGKEDIFFDEINSPEGLFRLLQHRKIARSLISLDVYTNAAQYRSKQ